MSLLAGIACRRIHTPEIILDDILILFEGERIGPMGSFASSWLEPGIYNARSEDLIVVPGLIDVHVHGGGGSDFLDRTAEAVDTISLMAARGGATSIVATTTIPNTDGALEGLEKLVHIIRTHDPAGARILGIYLEGPFLNPEKRGGFGPRYVQPASAELARRLLDICGDTLLKVTLAPEIPGGRDVLEVFANAPHGVQVSLGHSTIAYDDARALFDRPNIRQVTHAFNAMDQFHHRAAGLIGATLLDDRAVAEIIPDGHHLAGPAIELLYKIKGHRNLIIITDGTGATGTPQGTPVESVGGTTMVSNGAVRLANGALAGSNLLMAGAVAAASELGRIPFDHALRMATINAAKSVASDAVTGSMDPGKYADFCVLRRDGSVAATIRGGRLVYQATSATAPAQA